MRFPLILGPIVRRADPRRVCVWAATADPIVLRGKVLRLEDGNRKTKSKRPAIAPIEVGSGTGRRFQLGSRLYVHLIELKPTDKVFPSGELLAYDLEVLATGQRLRESAREDGVTLGDVPLPTFLLSSVTAGLRVLHGSCRKPHGDGEDAALVLERALQEKAASPTRPAVLFLTGDQIYADDVAHPLIAHLTAEGERLTGFIETIPGLLPAQPRSILPGNRTEIVADQLGFTSHEAGSHLMTFGEFSAMYFLAWSPDAWPKLAATPPVGVAKEVAEVWQKQLRALHSGKAAAAAMRRVFANIPTYMMFDDHEITDDWYRTSSWRDRVLRSRPAGRRVIANGLAAYWAFQGWGNDPDACSTAFTDAITSHLMKPGDGTAFERALIAQRWSFAVPSRPVGLCIDSRTRRTDPTWPELPQSVRPLVPALENTRERLRKARAPRLVDKDEWDSLAKLATVAGHRTGDPVVIVSPAPVVGFEALELLQMLASVTESMSDSMDLESWAAHPDNHMDFFRFLDRMQPAYCAILSGDVHYAFAAAASVEAVSSDVPLVVDRSHKVAQFTSSATKNQASRMSRGFLWYLANRFGDVQKALAEYLGDGFAYWDWPFPFLLPVKIASAPVVRLLPGHPVWRLRAAFESTRLGSTVVTSNNVGMLCAKQRRVEHKLLQYDRTGVDQRLPVQWSLGSWPV